MTNGRQRGFRHRDFRESKRSWDNFTNTGSKTSGWNPPAHLEARFGRKRRRPGTSSPCNHPLTNSNLATTRRQTLLETRKSLLRQRAAYVEKVRRARANSHEAVSERLLALQQSLSQAQDSRNAILAKIAGSCASEVAKAKQVAQEIRARREEEARVLKSGVEERMLEAERRRKEVLRDRRGKRRERGSSSSMKVDGSSEEEGDDAVAGSLQKIRPGAAKPTEMLKEEAAIHIQRVYRNYRNREIVRRFLELGLTIESVRDTSFEAISMKFQEEKVQKATARLLKLCGLLEHLEEVGRVEIEKACRTFLSAFLILGHPGEVLSDDGESEKALITKSKDLLIAFESFLSSPTFPPDQSLFTAWDAFNTGFTAWKTRDSEILINTMVAQYAELDLIWQKVKDDTEKHVASDFKEGIRENQLLLLVRIRRLAGERTRALIRQAVKEARRTRLPKKEKRDTRPRATPTASDGNSVSTKDEGSSVSSDAAVASITPASSTQPPETPAGGAGQSGFSPMEDSAVFSNRQIVHELALDKDFKLKTRKKGGLERMVEEQARRAFWDAMKEDVLERGELAKWIPRMAGDVKDKLLRLLEPTGSLHRMISDSIDIQIIEQQCRAGSYDYEKFFSYVLSILPKICSPARDDDVQALLNDTGDYIHRLQRLFDVLELLQLDHANFLLMVSAQYVIPEAVPYERHLFAGDLEAGRTTLTQTNQWLLKAKEEKLEEARSRDPEGVDHPSNSPSSTVIYNHAFASLIMSLGGPLTLQEIPETFHLDIERIQSYREEFRNLVLGAAMGITIKNLLRRDVRSSWKPLKDRISADLSSEIPLEPPAIAQDLCTFLQETMATPKQVISHATSAITRIATRSGSQEHQDPVVRVVSNRLLGFVLARLNAGTSKEKVRLATSGGDTLTSFGMAEWISEVGAFVERSVALADLNRNCYAVWYDGILA